MTNSYKFTAVLLIAALSFLVNNSIIAQTTTSKIPFQGSLYDQGVPVNGTTSIVFSITALGWTETQSVQVVNGLYSAVLGSVTPLPANLFTGVDSQQLAITVEGVSIGSVDIYAAFQGDEVHTEYFIGKSGNIIEEVSGADTLASINLNNTNGKSTIISPAFMRLNNLNGNRAAQLFVNANGAGSLYTYNDFGVVSGWFGNQADKGGLWQIIGDDGAGNTTGAILSGFWNTLPSFIMEDANAQRGVVYEIQTDGTNNWSYLNLYKSAADGSTNNSTVELDAGTSKITLRSPDGSSVVTIDAYNGISGGAASNADFAKDITGATDSIARKTILTGSVDPANTAWYQIANYNEAQSTNGNNVAVFGTASANSGFWQTGVLGEAKGDGTAPRYGVRGEVSGTTTTYSVASLGYNLVTPPVSGTVTGVYGRTFEGSTGSFNYGVRARAQGTAGKNIGIFAEALNSVDENWAGWFEGDVHITGNLTVNGATPGSGASTSLNISDGAIMGGQSFASINIVNDPGGADPTGYSSEMFLKGTSTPNFQIGGQPWANNNLPFMSLYGSTSDGGSWYHANMNIRVDTDGTSEAGTISIYKTNIAGQTTENTITLDGMTGSITGQNFDLNNGVNGFVNIGAKTWEGLNGNRRGFLHLHGTEDGLPNADVQRVFLEVSDNGSGSYGTLGLKNYEDDGGGNGKVTIDLNGENGSIYLNSGAGNVTLDGQNGNISVSGDVNSNTLTTTGLQVGNTIVAGDAFDNGVHINDGAPIVSIWTGGSGLDDGIETILLNGDNAYGSFSNGAGSVIIDGINGNVSASGNMDAVAFNTTSDKRYKKNIATIQNALSITAQLRGVKYNWRVEEFANKGFTNKQQVGLIAQEVEEVLPELVHTDDNGFKSVNYAQMTAVLIEAVKELNAKIETLESENSDLKAEIVKVNKLEEKINRIEKLLTGGDAKQASITSSK